MLTRINELQTLADEHDGLLTAWQARQAGITDSVLTKLSQHGRLERMARGVYRIPHFPLNRFSQYREAILWAQAHRGPSNVALSHESALAAFGISDANPADIHLTVPRAARLRREKPKSIVLHRADLAASDITIFEGIPVTTVNRTVTDLLESDARIDLTKHAITDARRQGFIPDAEAKRLRRRVERRLAGLPG